MQGERGGGFEKGTHCIPALFSTCLRITIGLGCRRSRDSTVTTDSSAQIPMDEEFRLEGPVGAQPSGAFVYANWGKLHAKQSETW